MMLDSAWASVFRELANQRPFELVVDVEPPHDPQRREILPLEAPCMYCGRVDEWEAPLTRWGAVMAPVCRDHLADAEELAFEIKCTVGEFAWTMRTQNTTERTNA